MSAKCLRDDLTDAFVANLFDDLLAAMTDDLDTVKLLAAINHSLNAIIKNKLTIDTKELFIMINWLDTHILKIGLFEQQEAIQVPADIQAIAQSRREAKLAKDYATADELRKQLHAAGRDMLDGKDGFEVVKKN
jgi:cysteinyl-tRNA synthetase